MPVGQCDFNIVTAINGWSSLFAWIDNNLSRRKGNKSVDATPRRDSLPIPNVRRIRHRSRVKWFDTRRGFGFIVSPEGDDIFVHYSTIRQEGFRTLEDGEEVEYIAEYGDKGWYALEVYPTEEHRNDSHQQARVADKNNLSEEDDD